MTDKLNLLMLLLLSSCASTKCIVENNTQYIIKEHIGSIVVASRKRNPHITDTIIRDVADVQIIKCK